MLAWYSVCLVLGERIGMLTKMWEIEFYSTINSENSTLNFHKSMNLCLILTIYLFISSATATPGCTYLVCLTNQEFLKIYTDLTGHCNSNLTISQILKLIFIGLKIYK